MRWTTVTSFAHRPEVAPERRALRSGTGGDGWRTVVGLITKGSRYRPSVIAKTDRYAVTRSIPRVAGLSPPRAHRVVHRVCPSVCNPRVQIGDMSLIVQKKRKEIARGSTGRSACIRSCRVAVFVVAVFPVGPRECAGCSMAVGIPCLVLRQHVAEYEGYVASRCQTGDDDSQ